MEARQTALPASQPSDTLVRVLPLSLPCASVSVPLSISISPSFPSLVTVNKFDFPSREFYSRNNVVHLLEFKAPLHIISFVFAAFL